MATTKTIELLIKAKGDAAAQKKLDKVEKELVDVYKAAKKTERGLKDFAKAEQWAATGSDRLANSTKKAKGGIDRMRVSTAGIRRKLGELRNVLLVVTFAFAGMIRAMNKAIDAYAQQWRAEQKLAAAMRNVAGNTSAATRGLIQYASAMQKVTTFGDENIINAMAQLSTWQLNAEAVKAITPRMLDMAAAMEVTTGQEQDLFAVSNALGKAFTGQAGALRRYNVSFDLMKLAVAKAKGPTAEFNFLLEEMDKNFKGISQQLATSTIGQIRQYEMAIGDASEKVGRTMLPVRKWYKQASLAAAEFAATLAIIKMNADPSFKGIKEMVQMWKDARKELKSIIEDPFIDTGGLGLTKEMQEELDELNKWWAEYASLMNLWAIKNDGVISSQEQLNMLWEQSNFINELYVRGLIEKIEYETQLNNIKANQQKILHSLTPELQFQVGLMRDMASTMASAALSGEHMGKAIANAIKQIAVQLAASLAVFALAKAMGFDIGFLMGGSGQDRLIGSILGQGEFKWKPPQISQQPKMSSTQSSGDTYYIENWVGGIDDETSRKIREGQIRIGANA